MSIQLQNINRQIVLAYKEYDEKVDKSKREPIRERIGHLFEEKRADRELYYGYHPSRRYSDNNGGGRHQ